MSPTSHHDTAASSPTAANDRPPVSDSPWFWINLFLTVGLILLGLTLPRIEQRQRERDLEGQARRWSESANEDSPSYRDRPESDSADRIRGATQFQSRWLIVILAAGNLATWIIFAWRRAQLRRPMIAAKETDHHQGESS